MNLTSPGVVNFDNGRRAKASTGQISFAKDDNLRFPNAATRSHTSEEFTISGKETDDPIILQAGSYLVEFNESVAVPLHSNGQIFVRSSLFRSRAMVSARIMDSSYKGGVAAMLQEMNPHRLVLYRTARPAQMAFHEMSEPVEGHNEVDQGQGMFWSYANDASDLSLATWKSFVMLAMQE